MNIIAQHLSKVNPSAVSVMSARAHELARQGRDIIRLTAGEPDLTPPDRVKLAAIKALANNQTKYPPIVGLPELREAICAKLLRDNSLAYQSDQVIVSSGAKQVLYNAFAATLNPGDQVLLSTPYWMSYPAMVKINHGEPVFLPTKPEDEFKLRPEVLEAAVTPRTRWLLLNSPSNPSGTVYNHQDLAGIAEVLKKSPQVWIVSDDIYEYLVYDKARFISILNVAPELAERTLVVNGFSKAYCMPGLRLGYGAGSHELIKGMFKIQTQSTSGAATPSQWAGVAALAGDHSFVARNNQRYQNRRDFLIARINQIGGLSCRTPQGAFYCLILCQGIMGRATPRGEVISSDEVLSNYLLEEVGLATVPGAPFGISPYFRISFAVSRKILSKGLERLADALARLS
jgi:aspartate aminotransferase